MRTFLCCSLILSIIVIVECRVYQSPNADDKDYWHNYNLNYLKKILNSNTVDSRVAKNVILFVGDGMSLATIASGRVMKGQLEGKSGEETELVFENFAHLGMAKTYNTDSQVPDSAATATALFSGIKTSIRTIGLNPAKKEAKENDRLKTIMDWAQKEGKRTGIVTTTRISHATPAASYAYAAHRDYECDSKVPDSMKSHFKDISRQLIECAPGNKMNVIFGGGRDFLGASIEDKFEAVKFKGNAEESCNRTDNLNLVNKFLERFETDNETVAKYVTNTGELMDALSQVHHLDHVLGLFANNHMSYNSLRNTESGGEPSLTEMTKAAIQILGNKKNKKGYVLMVEGGKIDQAHHQNHARLALEEFVELERAIKKAVEMTSNEDTLIIVTSDHAHSMVYNGYGQRGNDILGFGSKINSTAYETLVYATGPGFWQHLANKTKNESPFLSMDNFSRDMRRNPLYMHSSLIPMKDAVHSGEDVAVYSNGPGSFLLQRVFEQCYVGYAISYASCIGPAKSLNPSCSSQVTNFSTKSSKGSISLLLISSSFIFIHKIILH